MNTPSSPSQRVAPKVGKNAIGCALFGIAVFAALVCGMMFMIAKSGIIRVPLFSTFYQGPSPTRLVSAQPLTPAAFKVLLGSRFISQAVAHVPPPYTIQLSEKELTGAVMDAVETALRDQTWKQVYSQIVIRPTDLEMYVQFERGPWRAEMLARFQPVVTSGGVRFDPLYVQIGDLHVPAAAAYRLASYLFSRDLGTWTVQFGDQKLQSVVLHDGTLNITAEGSR